MFFIFKHTKVCAWHRPILLLVILFAGFQPLWSQVKTDSIRQVLQSGKLNTADYAESMVDLSFALLENEHLDSGYNTAVSALEFARLNKLKETEAYAKLAIVFSRFDKQPYDSSILILEDIIRVLAESEKKNALARAFNLCGIAFERRGLYKQAIQNYYKAMYIFEEKKDLHGLADTYNNIGLLYQAEKRYTEATAFFKRSLELVYKMGGNHNSEANALNNLAIVYHENHQPREALKYFLKVYELDKKENYPPNLALSYNNLGLVYSDLGQMEKAIDYLRKSIAIKASFGATLDLGNAYNNLGFVYLKKNWLDSSEIYFRKAEKLATTSDGIPLLLEVYDGLHKVFQKKNNFKEAYTYLQKFDALKDTIYRKETSSHLDQLQLDYLQLKSEKNEAETNSFREKARFRKTLLISGVLISFLVLLIMWFYLVRVKRVNHELNAKQKKIEIQNKILQVKNVEILQAKEAAEEAAKVKAQFISTISHEIRTPLNAIVGVTNLLQQSNPPTSQLENLNILKISSDNLLALVNNILDFSKMEAGKMQFENIEFNLKSIVLDIRDLFSVKAAEKGVELLVSFDEKIPAVLKGDPLRINQLLINLVSNAIKFTERGYVKIEVGLQLSTVNHSLVHFKIKDTGIGISNQKQNQIFESFTQADGNITRKYGGSGLGLSICKRILENLNSKLQLSSEPGTGSTFYFSINFEVSRNAAVGKSQRTASFEDSLKGKRVLIAEDNMMNILVIRQFLHKWEVLTDVVMNGKEAYSKALTETFDAILMDIHMPEMDGIEATKLIRKIPDERKRRIPIIAITAENEMQFRQKVYEVGMNDYIFKPFNPDDLKERLGYVLYNNHLFVSQSQKSPSETFSVSNLVDNTNVNP